MYKQLAMYYDELMCEDFDYDLWADYMCSFIGSRVKGLDLACGTGNITYRIMQRGKSIIGLDISKEMISVAKSKNSNKSADFFVQDMLKFSSQEKYEFVTCCCDGVNYINKIELEKLAQNVYNYLEDDGIFLFDISSQFKLYEIIGDNVFYHLYDDFNLLWTNEYKKGCNGDYIDMMLHFYIKETSGLFRLTQEDQRQYVHREKDVVNAIKKAGFRSIEIYDCFSKNKAHRESQRIQFVVKK